MATYLDTSSLAPSADLAARRCRELQLGGQLVPELWRYEVLQQAGTGDTVICGPQALDFWRKLSPQARLYSVADLVNADPLTARMETWEEWAMVQSGIPRADARRYLEAPPKTARHKRHAAYLQALSMAHIMKCNGRRRPTIPSFEQVDVAAAPPERPYQWTLVDSVDTLVLALAAIERAHSSGDRIGYDTETDTVGDHPNPHLDRLVGAAVACGSECYYGSTGYAPWLAALSRWLPQLRWIGHHSKWDLVVSRRHGILAAPPAGDSLLAAYLLGVPEAGLKKLVRDRYQETMITYEEVVGSGKERRNISEVDPQTVAEYCSSDAYWALRATGDLEGELDDQRRKLYAIDLKLVEVLAAMEMRGITFDRVAAQDELATITDQLARYGSAIDSMAQDSGWNRPPRTWVCTGCRNGKNKRLTCSDCHGVGQFSERQPFNPGSSDQVVAWLHDHLGLPVQGITNMGRPSVTALALLRLRGDHPGPQLILKWKQLDKFASFLSSWLEWSGGSDDALHSVFTMARTRSGRLSSTDPNLQQVKREWRRFFVARPGMSLIAADYGQIELRVAAALSQDPALIEATGFDYCEGTTCTGNKYPLNLLYETDMSRRVPLWYTQAHGKWAASPTATPSHNVRCRVCVGRSAPGGGRHSGDRPEDTGWSSPSERVEHRSRVDVSITAGDGSGQGATPAHTSATPQGTVGMGSVPSQGREGAVPPPSTILDEGSAGVASAHLHVRDIHAQNVERIFGVSYEQQQAPDFDTSLRVRAKNYGFGALYLSEGQEVQVVLEQQILADDTLDVPVPTVGEIHAAIEVIRNTYSQCFHEWMPAVIARAEELGGWVYTMHGRPRFLPELVHGDKYQRKHAARQAISHVVQGTAADFLRFALFRLDAVLPPEVRMLVSVHDEILFEVAAETASGYVPLIVETMQLGQPLAPVPITVDVKVAANWHDAH